jgi:hypothetical protein
MQLQSIRAAAAARTSDARRSQDELRSRFVQWAEAKKSRLADVPMHQAVCPDLVVEAASSSSSRTSPPVMACAFVPPAVELSKRVLQDAKPNFIASMRHAWEARHEIVRHEDVAKLGAVGSQPSKC